MESEPFIGGDTPLQTPFGASEARQEERAADAGVSDGNRRRKVMNGEPSNDLVMSAYARIPANRFSTRFWGFTFPRGAQLPTLPTARACSGKRFRPTVIVSWQRIWLPEWTAEIFLTGTVKLTCVVFDPPYMHSPGGTASRGSGPVRKVLQEQRHPGTAPHPSTMKPCWNSTTIPLRKRPGFSATAVCS